MSGELCSRLLDIRNFRADYPFSSEIPSYAVELALSVVSQRRNELHSTAGAGAWIDETTEMEDTLHEYCMGIEGPCILLLLLYEFGP